MVTLVSKVFRRDFNGNMYVFEFPRVLGVFLPTLQFFNLILKIPQLIA